MPRIKVDHIVSFSSEDDVHVASNILNNDMTKKWKSQGVGEPSVSVILQLEKATKISGIDICNESSAFIEALVGRSSSQDQPYKPILVMSSFMTPMESKDLTNCNRVRLFTYKDLAPDVRDQKWDRVKFNCTQPFNRKIHYGLSYITLHSPQEQEENKTELKHVTLGKFTLRAESPDILSSGSFFTQRKDDKETASEEMKKISSKEWLDKHGTPKCQSAKIQPSSSTNSNTSPLNNNTITKKRDVNLFYDSDDDKPHEKIDKVIAKKKEEDEMKRKQDSKETPKRKNKQQKDATPKPEKKTPKQNKVNDKKDNVPSTSKRKVDRTPNRMKKKVKLITKPFNQLLSDVIFTISGFVNPERSNLRDKALELGAKYKPNWDLTCTHLICAFANTPKFKEVQGRGKIVKKTWIDDCYSQRKRLPWRRYALDKNDEGPESEDEIHEQKMEEQPEEEIYIPPKNNKTNDVSGSDTEDEVERILAKQKEQDKKEEKQEEKETDPFEVDTDEEKFERININISEKIPKIFKKDMFYIDDVFSDEERSELQKMITIINGYLLDELRIVVDYIITNEESADSMKERYSSAKIVSSSWIYEIYNNQKLVPIEKYLLT